MKTPKELYDNIIMNAIENPPLDYSEVHHIIPRSLGGDSSAKNLVKLKARDHFRCHQLLIEMYPIGTKERQKMAFALHKMAFGTQKSSYDISPEEYENVRKLNAEASSLRQRERFQDPNVRQVQIDYALVTSKRAAEKNTNNIDFQLLCSKRTQRRIEEGTHNFLGGEIQRSSWENPEFRARQEQINNDRITNGTHTFIDKQFIEDQRKRLIIHWSDMTSEQRIERGHQISAGRKHARLMRELLESDEQ